MKKLLLVYFTIISNFFYGQLHTLSGYVKDINTGEALIGASVFIEGEGKGASTNVYGFYSITLSAGNHNVKYSYVGYEDILRTIDFRDHVRVNIELKEAEDLLDEVVVEARQTDENTTGTQMGKVDLSMDKMRSKVHTFCSYPLKITYSPYALIREQSLKKFAWKDFQFVRDFVK